MVWIGGVALALGGIFLVRYSIEAGLFTPGLRVISGALLAAMLVSLGELARRREVSSGIEQSSVADIPSILTAAGTTCAYADVWAAYALYQFLSPGVARKAIESGMTAGIWDVFIAAARQGFHGMWLEMKWGRNGPTDEQKRFQEYGEAEGYRMVIARHLGLPS